MKYFFAIISIFYFSINIFANGTLHFTFNNYDSFNTGKFNNIVLNEDGKLYLSPKLEKLTTNLYMYIWDIKMDSKGNIYFATGNDGIVYKMDKKGKVTTFFETASIAAFKLLIDRKDNIYIATLTKGIVYKVTPDGKGKILYVFKDKNIWDMKFSKDGNLLLATGSPGVLYKLYIKSKKIETLALTREMNITTIACYNNTIYFGTSDNGAIYSLHKGKLKVVYETFEEEVHTIIVKDGIIYAATADKEYKLPDMKNLKNPSYDDNKDKNKSSYKNELDKLNKELKKYRGVINRVYKIVPDKEVVPLIESNDTTFLSLIFDNKKNLYIGTGDDGIIYRYNKNKKVEKLLQLDSQQVLTFYKSKKGDIFVGTGNPGFLYKLKIKYSKKGYYLSDILNANGFAKWGRINIDYSKAPFTDIQVYTRSGNVKEIDDTWSDWEKLNKLDELYIKSPSARYIQYKIVLKSYKSFYTPIIYSVDIPYIVNNRAPEVLEIKLRKPKKYIRKISSKNSSLKKISDNSFELELKWKADDPDKDKLIYSVWASPDKTKRWILIKDNIEDTYLKFDSRYLPDGIYKFKVIADDIPSNTLKGHLTDYKISKSYIIDSTPPEFGKFAITKIKNNYYLISGNVKDNLSNIVSISYLDGIYKWINVFPSDGIFDSKLEGFSFEYKYDKSKDGIIIIKAEDAAGNIATHYIKIKKY